MKYLLINRVRTDNYGDQAISIAMQKLLSEVSPDSQVFSEDIAYSGFAFALDQFLSRYIILRPFKKVISRLRRNKFIWRIENTHMFSVLKKHKFDCVIIGGGELIQSNGLFPIGFKTWVDNIIKYQKDVPIVLFGVGVTKSYSCTNFRYISDALSKVTKIYVRDKESAKNLKSIFNYDSKIIPDVVFFNPFNKQVHKRNTVLYGVTSWSRIKKYGIYAVSKIDYYGKCINDIIKFMNQGYTVLIFYTTQADYTECISFEEYCRTKQIAVSIVKCNTLSALLSEMSYAMVVSSPRMHGCILGFINGSEVFPQIISPKMQSFYETYFNGQTVELQKLSGEIKSNIIEAIN